MTRPPKIIALVFLLALPNMLGGCASMVVGAGAAAGVAAFEERSFAVHAEDTTLATKIRYNLLESKEKFATNVGLEVYEGRVLMTGVVKTEEMRAEALRQAWKVEGVKDVFNELQIGDAGIQDFAKDSWVTTKLKSKMTIDKDILAINYSVETVNGIVYLIGIAQNQAEIDKVIAHARNLGYVKRVISHVRVKKAAA